MKEGTGKPSRLLVILLYLMLAFCLTASVTGFWGLKFLEMRGKLLVPNEYLWDDPDITREMLEMATEEKLAFVIGRKLIYLYLKEGIESVEQYCSDANILYSIYSKYGRRIGGTLPVEREDEAYVNSYTQQKNDAYAIDGMQYYKAKIIFNNVGYFWDQNTRYGKLERLMVNYREWFLISFAAGTVLSVLFFVLLVREGSRSFDVGRIPLEIVTAFCAVCLFFACKWLMKPRENSFFAGMEWCRCLPVAALVGVSYGIHLLATLRTAKWYRGTLCYILFSRLGQSWMTVLQGMPQILKMFLAAAGLSAVELASILVFLPDGNGRRILLGIWAAEKLLLAPFLLCRALALKKVQLAAGELAAGNLKFQLDTDSMPKAFREFGRNLNAVADSVSLAVDDRVKSERLKTELITNVSHDIKTPLTSIINFSDLISREKTENEKIREYAGLLYKQSTRLKKLIEDLIEASKASTGNLEMNPEYCEVKTLLAQCIGEYEQVLREMGVELIVKMAEEPVWITVDTRMLWRIFENLMNNICKYTQKETRVYLSMERHGDRVRVTFKNISKYPLDIAAEDLMERFVRGDLSRHTEGNGLGLSIVKSLMDLLQGRIELAVDGDLFKVILDFPVAEAPVGEPLLSGGPVSAVSAPVGEPLLSGGPVSAASAPAGEPLLSGGPVSAASAPVGELLLTGGPGSAARSEQSLEEG